MKYIRRVTKVAKDGWAKKVRDRRAEVDLERVLSAQTSHTCHYYGCTYGGKISSGVPYVKVFRHGETRRIGSMFIPLVSSYHLDCLPPELHPNLRFFGRTQ